MQNYSWKRDIDCVTCLQSRNFFWRTKRLDAIRWFDEESFESVGRSNLCTPKLEQNWFVLLFKEIIHCAPPTYHCVVIDDNFRPMRMPYYIVPNESVVSLRHRDNGAEQLADIAARVLLDGQLTVRAVSHNKHFLDGFENEMTQRKSGQISLRNEKIRVLFFLKQIRSVSRTSKITSRHNFCLSSTRLSYL